MNSFENRIGLVLCTLMNKLGLNLIIRSVDYYLRRTTRVFQIVKKLCDLDRDLKQTAFILLTQKFPLSEYVIRGQRNTFATSKGSNVISLFQRKTVSSPPFVLENQSFERIPIFYQNKLQFVVQVTCKTFPWFIKAPCKTDNFE